LIRKTLDGTQEATWAIQLFVPGRGAMPAGSGFFVGDGLFATANHVIEHARPIGVIRAERREGDLVSLRVTEVVFADRDSDFALLRVASHPAHGNVPLPTPIKVGARELDEGEPVYSCGYPLTDFGPPILLDIEELREMGFPVDDGLTDEGQGVGDIEWPENFALAVMNDRLSPRTTSAIVASVIEYYATVDLRDENFTRDTYVLDKALNYGNSGGPIVASDTSCHADSGMT
jgi:serine protease Do